MNTENLRFILENFIQRRVMTHGVYLFLLAALVVLGIIRIIKYKGTPKSKRTKVEKTVVPLFICAIILFIARDAMLIARANRDIVGEQYRTIKTTAQYNPATSRWHYNWGNGQVYVYIDNQQVGLLLPWDITVPSGKNEAYITYAEESRVVLAYEGDNEQ